MLRGGSWDDLAVDCRSANRYAYPRDGRRQTIGFRRAMSLATGGAAVADAPAGEPRAALAASASVDPMPPDPHVDRRPARWTERPAAARVLRRRAPRPQP